MIVRELAFVLGFQNLIGPLIDLRDGGALLHEFTFGEVHVGHIAADLRLNGDGSDGSDGAQRIDHHGNAVQHHGRGADRLQSGLELSAASGSRLWRQGPAPNLIGSKAQQDHNDQSDDNARFGEGGALHDRIWGGTAKICRQPFV